jgi:hypothetical protein
MNACAEHVNRKKLRKHCLVPKSLWCENPTRLSAEVGNALSRAIEPIARKKLCLEKYGDPKA